MEELTKSLFAQFESFSVNDYGYIEGTKDWVHPLFLKAQAATSKEDNPTWWEAMHGPLVDEYWKAAITDSESLEETNEWKYVDNTKHMDVLQSTWALKLKHFPNGLLKKFKANFFASVDQNIQGRNFFETCALVVQS